MRLRVGAMVCFSVGVLALVACGDKTYDVTFTCTDGGGAGCAKAQTCPTVPLGSGGCETLPGMFGHSETKVDVGRPVGCEVGLSYGNPYYGDDQQTCRCDAITSGAKPSWTCPI